MKEIDIIKHLDEVNAVATEFLKGKNESEIAQQLELSRAQVSNMIVEWKTTASNSEAIRSRAREALSGADAHYNRLIKEAYAVIDDANSANESDTLSKNQTLTHRLASLKMVADLEAKRIDMLQRAGLLENQELADSLIEQERQHEAIMAIITDVVGSCPICKPKVLARMQGIGPNPVTIVEGDTVG